MPVWVHKKNATKFMKPLCIRTNEWPNPACKHVHNGVLNTVLLYIAQAPSKGIDIVCDSLCRTYWPAQHLEAMCAVVVKFAYITGIIDRASDMVLNIIRYLIFCQLINEGLVTAILRRNSLRANDENVLQPSSPVP